MRADKSLSPFEIRVYRHYRIVHGTRGALAFLLTFLIIRLFTIPESTWPLVTMVVIMGPISFWGNVVPRAFERIGGTVLGSILGLIALQLELISLPLMLVWCAAAMFLCGWLALGKKPYQGLLIGVTLAMLFTGIWPQRAFIHWRIQLAKSLTEYNRVLYYPSSAEKIGQFSLPAVRMPYRALG
ncbi:FUSC family protein, partial [Escherichia coli]|uniref:FUSC family protein n=2 Tax=Escherichia coli TaxID=562 RepID=UPI002023A1B0